MSLPQAALQFNFSGITGTTLPNLTGTANNGTIDAGVTSGTDPEFGDYLEFNGSNSVTIPALPGTGTSDFANGITITAWVYMTATTTQCNILHLSATGNNSITADYSNIAGWLLFNSNDENINVMPAESPVNQWVYMAMSFDAQGNGQINFFANGQWQQKTGTCNALPAGLGTVTGYISHTQSQSGGFQGKIAWLSVYNQVLTQTQLAEDMALAHTQAIKFRKSFPLDFSLTTNQGGDNVPVLFIEREGEGKDMSLSIVNSGTADFSIPNGSGAASDTNFHFQLHFQPGVLSQNYRAKAGNATTQTWALGSWSFNLVENAKTGNWHLNMLNTGSAASLTPGQSQAISLGAINADPLGGARNTTVMLQYNLPQAGAQPLIGHRKQTLSIISRLGQKDIPLNVGVVGAPRILTNGVLSSIQLRIENTGKDPIPWQSTIEQAQASFELGFDIQPTGDSTEWALVDQADISGLSCTTLYLGKVKSLGPDGSSCTIIDTEGSADVDLTADEQITIYTSNGEQLTVAVPFGQPVKNSIVVNNDSKITSQALKGAVITGPNSSDWAISEQGAVPTNTSGSFYWTITSQTTSQLAPGAYIDFTIVGIKSNLPAGQSFITLKYYNIGGYWDGEFTIPIERSPQSISAAGVGIGMPASDDRPLQVAGPDQTPSLVVDQYGYVEMANSVSIGCGLGNVYKTTALNLPYPNASNRLHNGLRVGDNLAEDDMAGQPEYSGAAIMVNRNSGGSTISPFRYSVDLYNDNPNDPELTLFEIDTEGRAGFGLGAFDSNMVSIQYPGALPGIVSGIRIGDLDNNNAGSNGAALSISVPGNDVPAAVSIKDQYGRSAMTVDVNGLTACRTLAVTAVTDQAGHVPFTVGGYDSDGYSIQTSKAILCTSVNQTSDERTKKSIIAVDNQEHLNTLNQLQVRQYELIDAANPGQIQVGLIAQELKEAFPQAVNQVHNYLPDIMAKASALAHDRDAKTLKVDLDKPHGLQPGDEVRLVADESVQQMKVIEVNGSQSFTVGDCAQAPSEVMVYGKLVEDFLAVDYNQIQMLSISAVQQLSKEVETLKAANQALQDKLDTELAAIKASLKQ